MNYTCAKCGECKPGEEFPYAKARRHSWCRVCNNAVKKVRRHEARRTTNPRKNRIAEDYITCDGKWVCSKCKVPQAVDQYQGRIGWCNSCRAKLEGDRRRAEGIAVRPKTVIENGKKSCVHCWQMFPVSDFSPTKRGRGGVSAYCRPCAKSLYYNADRAKKNSYRWRQENRAKHLANHRIHQFNRKKLAKAVCDGTLNGEALNAIYQREICTYCLEFTPVEKRTLDHVIPLAKGGVHSILNATMACRSCNSTKRDMDAQSFIQMKRKSV